MPWIKKQCGKVGARTEDAFRWKALVFFNAD